MDQHKYITNILKEYHTKSKNWHLHEKMRRLGSLEAILILNGIMGAGEKIEYMEEQDYESFILEKSAELLSTHNDNNILDSQDFYEIMQTYRHSDMTQQTKVTEAFENVKKWIRENIISVV